MLFEVEISYVCVLRLAVISNSYLLELSSISDLLIPNAISSPIGQEIQIMLLVRSLKKSSDATVLLLHDAKEVYMGRHAALREAEVAEVEQLLSVHRRALMVVQTQNLVPVWSEIKGYILEIEFHLIPVARRLQLALLVLSTPARFSVLWPSC